jgi:peptidoglycan/xylan/chitin deacetylase (PgdA/CDA1 family)
MRRTLVIIVLLICALCIGLWQFSRARSVQLFGTIVSRIDTHDSVVALTLDDGPSRLYADSVLRILSEHAVKATFFVTGEEVEENPEQAQHIVQAGHELGNHSYSHSRMVLMGPERIREEIERTDSALRAAGTTGTIYFRPPFGKKLLMLPLYLSQHNRTTVTWDVEPESYSDIAGNAEAITAHVLQRVHPGSIILLHVMYKSGAESRRALPMIIEGLHSRGYRFVTVSELLDRGGIH